MREPARAQQHRDEVGHLPVSPQLLGGPAGEGGHGFGQGGGLVLRPAEGAGARHTVANGPAGGQRLAGFVALGGVPVEAGLAVQLAPQALAHHAAQVAAQPGFG